MGSLLESREFSLELYEQWDIFEGVPRYGLKVIANGYDEEPDITITINVPSSSHPEVCNSIGYLDAAFIDTKTYPALPEELIGRGIAEDTGVTRKYNSFSYPLFKFKMGWIDTLDEQSKINYEKYFESWRNNMDDAFGWSE